MNRIQLLLVDDHILFRESLRRLLESEPDFGVVSDCGTTAEACSIVAANPVDVVLLDFDLAGRDARECLGALDRTGFAGKILIVTGSMTAGEAATVLRLGASGIFYKHHSPSLLAQAIRHVASGMTWIDQPAMRLMSDDQERKREPRDRGPWTEREEQVLHGIFEGLANKEIGAKLGVSESAVKATLQQLFQKTGVRTRSQLVRVALESSLFDADPAIDSAPSGFRQAAARKIAER